MLLQYQMPVTIIATSIVTISVTVCDEKKKIKNVESRTSWRMPRTRWRTLKKIATKHSKTTSPFLMVWIILIDIIYSPLGLVHRQNTYANPLIVPPFLSVLCYSEAVHHDHKSHWQLRKFGGLSVFSSRNTISQFMFFVCALGFFIGRPSMSEITTWKWTDWDENWD
jgi:hypothetical protein